MIPQANAGDLMLRDDVVEAVAAGRFRGVGGGDHRRGRRGADGRPRGRARRRRALPDGSINGRVEARLVGFAARREEFPPASTGVASGWPHRRAFSSRARLGDRTRAREETPSCASPSPRSPSRSPVRLPGVPRRQASPTRRRRRRRPRRRARRPPAFCPDRAPDAAPDATPDLLRRAPLHRRYGLPRQRLGRGVRRQQRALRPVRGRARHLPAGATTTAPPTPCLEGCRDDNTCVAAGATPASTRRAPAPALRCDRRRAAASSVPRTATARPGCSASATPACAAARRCAPPRDADPLRRRPHRHRLQRRPLRPLRQPLHCPQRPRLLRTARARSAPARPASPTATANAVNGCEVHRRRRRPAAAPARRAPAPSATVGAAGAAFACVTGFADCDGNADNGCEVNLNADAANWWRPRRGAPPGNAGGVRRAARAGLQPRLRRLRRQRHQRLRGRPRRRQRRTAGCAATPARPRQRLPRRLGGRCVASCVIGSEDCDGVDATGCEVDVRTNAPQLRRLRMRLRPAHATGPGMAGRARSPCCESGFGRLRHGRVQRLRGQHHRATRATRRLRDALLSLPKRHGRLMCPTPRPLRHRAAPPAASDCDANAANGCEADVTTDTPANCGTCGSALLPANATARADGGRRAVACMAPASPTAT